MTTILQRHAVGLTWLEDDAMARASHALRTDAGVWLIDPFQDAAALDAAAELGPPAGVVQMLSRHNRDCAAIAERLGVPHHRLPAQLPGTPFTVISVVDRPWWQEIALAWPQENTLVVAEAVGTIALFAAGRTLGVHPMLRLVPPRAALGGQHPDRLLVGHGPAIETGADRALQEALARARSDLPRLALRAPGAMRAGPHAAGA